MTEGVVVGSQSFTQLKTLGQLRELVYAPLRDSERQFVVPAFVDAMLNEAYLDLNARLRIYEKTQTGTTSSTGTITIPSDMVEIVELWITDTSSVNIRIEVVSNETFNTWAKPATDNPFAYIARSWVGTIQTYPALNDLDYTLEYIARPAAMVEDADTPSILDPEMQNRLIYYARANGKWQEGEMDEGNQLMAMYAEGLPGRPRMTSKVKQGAVQLFPEPGPFG